MLFDVFEHSDAARLEVLEQGKHLVKNFGNRIRFFVLIEWVRHLLAPRPVGEKHAKTQQLDATEPRRTVVGKCPVPEVEIPPSDCRLETWIDGANNERDGQDAGWRIITWKRLL